MKQLLHTHDAYTVVGLNDRAFLVHESCACKLLAPSSSSGISTAANQPTNSSWTDEKQSHQEALNRPEGATAVMTLDDDEQEQIPECGRVEIQAVAVIVAHHDDDDDDDDGSNVWCAVSRSDKTLSLYQVNTNLMTTITVTTSTTLLLEPLTVHRLAKRALCLTFGTVDKSLLVVIAGDLIGDATAYSLVSDTQSKLLLGHTASMLTSIHVRDDATILTSDRDETIRVSCFPQTHVIQGFLLGHTSFVTCMDVSCNRCISCSGDGTVRLWDYTNCRQVAIMTMEDESLLPTRVCMSPNGTVAALIYNDCDKIDILSTNDGTSLEQVQRIDCPTQPLAITFFVSDTLLLVVAREPEYLLEYQRDTKSGLFVIKPDSRTTKTLRQVVANTSANLIMPRTIMEMDERRGVLKLQKESGEKSKMIKNHPEVAPWNKIERVHKAREADSRRQKRRRHKLKSERQQG